MLQLKLLNIKTVALICVILSIMMSCSASTNNMEINKKIDEILSSNDTINSGVTQLLALEQQYPKNIRIKLAIGQLNLLHSDIDRAGIYLNTAYSLYQKNKNSIDSETEYLMFSLLSIYNFNQEEYDSAERYINEALILEKEDVDGIKVTLARVYTKQEKRQEALSLFREIWNLQKDYLGIDIIQEYLVLEIEEKNWAQVVKIMSDIEYRFGQVISLGGVEAIAYNALGKETEKLFSYLKEMENKKFAGILSIADIRRNFSVMPKENLSERGLLYIDAIFAFYQGDFTEAWSIMSSIADDTSYQYYSYFRMVLQLMAKKGTEMLFKRYFSDDNDKRFSNTGAYYYYLWNGLKFGDGKYTLAVVKDTLENTIRLSPNTIYADQSRIELGQLVGLNKKQSLLILTQSELEQFYIRIADDSTALATILAPLLQLLVLDTNIYTNLVESFLQQVATDMPWVKSYLKNNSESYNLIVQKKLLNLGII